MLDPQTVTLEVASAETAPVLSNLLDLYLHDLSEIFPVEVGADGRFRYDAFPLYWSEPDKRFAFLIRSGARLAGFALATRGSPASDDPEALDVAEFFVLRGCRRSGVGQQAAFLLWNRLPGDWVVRVSEANRAGLPFWHTTLQRYTGGAFSEGRRAGSPHGWRVFTFRSVPMPKARPSAEPAVTQTTACRRYLVVDDNPDSVESLAMLLSIGGHEVHTAHDGLEAVAAAEQFRPDVVLMDIGLPRLNGLDAARRIREQPWGRSMVLIALSGWGQEENRSESKDAGFDTHLMKPVDPDVLMKLLASLK